MAAATRLPGGHPEGYLEAFGTLYREAADAMLGGVPRAYLAEDGVRSLAFVEAALVSSAMGGGWVEVAAN